jgi:predicted dehydrogenase
MVYHLDKRVDLVAVCDVNQKAAKEKGLKWGAKEVSTDFHRLTEMDLDLIDIITPTTTHAEIAITALEAGKNVLVEKPMALSSRECEAMKAAADKSGKSLCVYHGLCFLRSIKKLKETLMRDPLTPSRMRFSYFFAQPHQGFTQTWVFSEETGGVLWEAMVHHVYLSQFLMGNAQRVYAVANKLRQPVPDSLTLIIQSSSSKPTICEYEWNVKETQRIMQLMTTAGDRFDIDVSHDLLLRKSRRVGDRWRSARLSLYDDLSMPFVRWGTHLGRMLASGSMKKTLAMDVACFALIGEVISFIAGEIQSQPTTPDEGISAIRTLEAAQRSIATGNAESV